MKTKYYTPIAIIVVLVIVGIYFYLQQPTNLENQITYPTTSNLDFFQINEIKQNNFTSGNFNTEGYVVKIYTCPPCPNDPSAGMCKPCDRDNIVISENNKILETYSLTENELIIFVENPKQFELGKKYKFSIKILDYKSTGEPINYIELVGYDLIE